MARGRASYTLAVLAAGAYAGWRLGVRAARRPDRLQDRLQDRQPNRRPGPPGDGTSEARGPAGRTAGVPDEAVPSDQADGSILLQRIQAAVVVHAPDTSVLVSNPMAHEMLGLSGDQMYGRAAADPAWSFVREDGSPLPLGEYPVNHVLTSREPMRNRVIGVRRTDRADIVWASVNADVVRDRQGEIAEVVVTFIDISERKRAEEALRRSNRELQAISHCNRALVGAVDEQALLDEICQIICEEAGYCLAWVGFGEDDAARSIRIVARAGTDDGYLEQADLSWADTERGRGPAGTAIRTGQSARIQDFAADPQAEPWRESALRRGYRSAVGEPLKDENGTTFGVLCIYSTEPNAFTPSEKRLLGELAENLAFGLTVLRDRAEQRRAERVLRESEEKFATAFRSSPAALTVSRARDRRCLDVNDSFVKLTGYARDEVVGHSGDELSLWADPEQGRLFRRLLEERGGVDGFEYSYRRKNGSIGHGLASATFITVGGELCHLAQTVDISGRKQAEEEVRRLNQELERRVDDRTARLAAANRELEAFTYSVSHDLRAPLRAVSGFSEDLLDAHAEALNEEGLRDVHRIKAAAQRMARLIDDLLRLSGLSRLAVRPRPVDLSALVTSISEDLRQSEPRRRCSFVIASGVTATADPQLIGTVLENLLGNAWKYTSKRDEAVIEFGTIDVPDAEVCGFVRDNGVGFDATYTDRLFEPFQRLHTDREFPGTGIGLASARRVVERHGGRIWAEGQVDQGATIYFTLNAGATETRPTLG